ncbi:WD40 repeat domain-containing protein [Streptomyces sp. NPDC001219]
MNAPLGGGEPTDIHRRIAAALAGLVTDTPGVPPHPYLSRHLAQHAARGQVLDDVHVPPALLAWDTSASVRRLLHCQDVPHQRQEWLQTWAALEPFARDITPASRLTSLHLAHHAATCRRTPASAPAARAAELSGSRVTALWSDCSPPDNVWSITDTAVTSLAAVTTPGEGALVSGDDHGVVRMWRKDGTAAATPLNMHEGAVTHLLPLGPGRLATAGTDGTVAVLDIHHNRRLATVHRRPRTWVTSLALYRPPRDRHVLLAAHSDGYIAVLDAETYRPVDLPLPSRDNAPVLLATVHQRDTAPLLLCAQGETISVFDGRATFIHARQGSRVRALAALQEPGRYAVGDEAGNLTLYDTARPSREAARAAVPPGDALSKLSAVTVDGQPLLLSASTDGTVRRWNTTTALPVGDPLRGHTAAINAMALLPGQSGTRLITAGADHTLRSWLLAAEAARPPRPRWRPVTAAALADTPAPEPPPFFAVASGATTRLFNIRTGDRRTLWKDGGVTALTWIQNDAQLLLAAAMSDNSIRLTDPAGPKGSAGTRHLTGHYAPVLALETVPLPDRTILASASGDGSVRLWDLETEQALAVFDDHKFSVRALASAQTSDGPLLASGGSDGTARLWDPLRRTSHRDAIRCAQHNVNALAFVPAAGGAAAAQLATAGQDGTVKVWDIRSGHPTKAVAHRDFGDGPLTAVTSFPHPGKRTVVAAAGRSAIHLWDVTLDVVLLQIAVGRSLSSLASRTDPRALGPTTVITATGGAGTMVFRLDHELL